MKLTAFPDVENIIFDLGNVIIELDIEATNRAFVDLFGSKHDEYMRQLSERNVFFAYEKGEISTENFIEEVSSLATDIKAEAIQDAWNAMLLQIPDNRYQLLDEIKANYRTFCLSNTNEMHIDFINRQLMDSRGLKNLNPFFERVYLSHEMGMRKPEVEIFEKVIQDNQLNASKTLFIDDTAGHLVGAEKAGLQTFHMHAKTYLEALFA